MSLGRRLDAVCRARARAVRARSWPMGIVFAAGLAVSAAGVYAMRGRTGALWAMSAAAASFAFGTALWIFGPRLRPRIVPYFEAPLGRWGEGTSDAFLRGAALYEAIDRLEQLAAERQVPPLSAFGFADDLWGEDVVWHSAEQGLSTVEALGAAADHPRLAADLEAVARVLRVARDRNVRFSLVVRPWRAEHLQSVMSREERQGSFW